MKAGRLPNLAALIERGQTAQLASIRPPVSAAAWVSLSTGATPGQTGVCDTIYADANAFELHLNTSKEVSAPFVWEQLTGTGLRSFVYGAPLAAPAEAIDGVLVAGSPVPSEDAWTQPRELRNELNARGILADPQGIVASREFTVASFHEQLSKKRSFLLEHMASEDWDLGWVVFAELEQLHRLCWPGPQENELIKAYVALDSLLGELLALAGPQTDVLVVSEHGMRIYDQALGFNAMMFHEGFCAIRGPWQVFTPAPQTSLIENLNAEHLHRLSNLEFQLTRARAAACAGNFGSARLALEGMEPWAIVPFENHDSIISSLEARLEEQFSPFTLEPVTVSVHRIEDLYPGPETARIADIVFELDEEFLVTNDMILSKFRKLDPPVTASELNGIYIAAGPGFAPETERTTHSILDVVPTVLALLEQAE